VRRSFAEFSNGVAGMIDALDAMVPGRYSALRSYHKKFDFYTRFLLAPPRIASSPPFVVPVPDISEDDTLIGNKAKHLAIIQRELGAPVPRGFAITAAAYHHFIEYNILRPEIDALLAELDIRSYLSLDKVSSHLQELIETAELPPDIEEAIDHGCAVWRHTSTEKEVAVRSSGVNEDGASSFAGQYVSCLHVKRHAIGKSYKKVLASKYSSESLFYRITQGLGDEETAMSVLVQEMVAARCSGVVYSRDIEQENREQRGREQEHLHIYGVAGLGEALVGGAAVPHHYILNPQNEVTVVEPEQNDVLLSAQQACLLADWARRIDKHFGAPQDIEWALDDDGELRILQARELHAPNEAGPLAEVVHHDHEVLYEGGERAATGVATGPVYVVDGDHGIGQLPAGAVLVCRDTPPQYVTVLDRATAVLAERGSRASHFATVAREFRVPVLCGIADAVRLFAPGDEVSVDADRGVVYAGRVEAMAGKHRDPVENTYMQRLGEVLKFITPLELIDPAARNFMPEGCRSMHDIIRFCHENALLAMFSAGKPGSGRGALRLIDDMLLDVFLFDVGGGIQANGHTPEGVELSRVQCRPFRALWQGLNHPDVQWKQKPFDWDAYDKIELSGGVPPKKDSFAFASYAVIGAEYLHFNIRFGYHFAIVDVLCGDDPAKNHCMLRFAGGGGDFHHRSLRLEFLSRILEDMGFTVENKGDLLEGRMFKIEHDDMYHALDMLGRLLGATKLMDMVLEDEDMVESCVADFHAGVYSFSQEG
jgi:pyruvate,water dikinase